MLATNWIRITVAVVVTVGAALLAQAWYCVDWALLRSAVPPNAQSEPLSESVTVKSLTIDSNQVDSSECVLRAASRAEIKMIAAAETSQWRWSYSGNDPATQARRLKEKSLPQAFVSLEFLRYSMLPPGHVVSASCGSNPVRRNSNEMYWSRKITVPEAPGTYLVRVHIEKRFLTGSPHGETVQPPPEPRLLASFTVRVE